MTWIIALFLCPLALVTLCFSSEVLAGLRTLPTAKPLKTRTVRATILVPAHDEAAIIGASLSELKATARDLAHVVVIADNCTDATAELAAACGVEVVQRSDATRRGKGFALDFGRAHLQGDPPEVVVVIDADCRIDAPSLEVLITGCSESRRPCQAIYLMDPAPNSTPLVQISTFAFCVKNLVRQRGLQRLAGRVHLTGTGMAFPWTIFDKAELATASIVEDLLLGIRLAERGHPPLLIDAATIWSPPAGEEATLSQRSRWEGGFLATATKAAPKSIARGLASLNARALVSAVDLLIPPLALLVALNLAVLAAAALLTAVMGAHWWPVQVQCVLVVLACISVFMAWAMEGRRFISLGRLATVPLYVARKAVIYARLARHGAPKDWVRTERP